MLEHLSIGNEYIVLDNGILYVCVQRVLAMCFLELITLNCLKSVGVHL